LHRLGEINWNIGEARAAIAEFEASRATLEQSIQDDPKGTKARSSLARTLTTLGWRYEHTGRIDASERTLKQAVEGAEELVRKQPESPEWRVSLANALSQLGSTYAHAQRPDDAERVLKQAVTLLEAVVKEFPENDSYAASLSTSYASLGVLCYERLENQSSLD